MVPIEDIIREVIIEFMRASLPAYDIKDMAAIIFLSALQTSGVMSWTVSLVVPNGTPRYVKGMAPIVQPNKVDRSLHLSVGVLIGMSVDL